jgi:galactitol-specific phosphotransferase system IIB component
MNFFFGIKNKEISTKLTIPRFRNREPKKIKCSLFSAEIINNEWVIKNVTKGNNENFFFLDNDLVNNDSIFFLAENKEVERNNVILKKKLVDLNSFTNTSPSYRANLRIYNQFGGFSSYQSEYPYSMITKNGSILSPVSMLTNINSDYNKVFIKNIFHLPIIEKFKIYFIDIENKKILKEEEIISNYTNEINIEKNLINENVYIFSKKYIGIPIYVSSKKNHLSIEHTHPPHDYILGKDKFTTINKLKFEINEIIKQ